MRPGQPSVAEAEGFAANALLWLQFVTLAIGAAQFALTSETIERPLLAALALALFAASALVTRIVPALRRPSARQHLIDIAVLIIGIALLAVASGGARSTLLPLYAIPMAGVAVAFGRWWWVILFAALSAALVFMLGALTPGFDAAERSFWVALLTALGPGAAVALVLAALIDRMHSAVQRISDLASTDALTGLLNLRAFEEVLQQEHRKSERFNRPYTLVMIDVDNLAQVNEALGHEAGSQILTSVASAISRSIRNSDVAARLGGDEFVVLLAEASAATGTAIGQRIRNNVYAGTVSVANRLLRANVSVGTANYPDDHLYPKELMILADQRMQQDRELRRPPGPG